jgi:hypothetical protein
VRPDQAEAAGLAVLDLRTAALEMRFYDVAAVIVFLRKVIWIVPGFTSGCRVMDVTWVTEASYVL